MQKKSYPAATITWKPEDKASLALAIGRTFDLQKNYGKTTGQLENIVAGFLWALQPYHVEEVMEGLAKYIRLHSDMPTPSDIVAIIDPPQKIWEPDKSYYITLKQIFKDHGPYGLDREEAEYIRKYEEHMKNELRSSSC